jgi:hypothetical protein
MALKKIINEKFLIQKISNLISKKELYTFFDRIINGIKDF